MKAVEAIHSLDSFVVNLSKHPAQIQPFQDCVAEKSSGKLMVIAIFIPR